MADANEAVNGKCVNGVNGVTKKLIPVEWIRKELALGSAQATWAEMLDLAKAPGVVGLGQGSPDYEGSEVARKAACNAIMNKPELNQYSPPNGLPSLTLALAEFHKREYNVSYDPETEIVVTTSANEALFCIINAFCGAGDEVIVFDPSFPWYGPWIRMAGATPVNVTLLPPGFAIDEAALRAAITPRTRAVLLNTPHNPTGHVATAEELHIVANVCLEHGLLAISDEVYETAVFGGARHLRLAQVDGMKERTVTISGASKMFSLTGWRIGWAVGPSHLLTPMALIHNYSTYCSPGPLQEAIAVALDAKDYGKESAMFWENVQQLALALESVGATTYTPQGGYFLVADVVNTGMDDLEFCKWLAKNKKVSAMPMRSFYADGSQPCTLVRFAICKSTQTIAKAVKNITQ